MKTACIALKSGRIFTRGGVSFVGDQSRQPRASAGGSSVISVPIRGLSGTEQNSSLSV